MAEWGRKQYSKAWPSRTPVWTWAAILLSFVFLAGMLTLEYERSWTAAEGLYLSDYLKSGARGQASVNSGAEYTLLEAVVGKGQRRLVTGDEIEPVAPLKRSQTRLETRFSPLKLLPIMLAINSARHVWSNQVVVGQSHRPPSILLGRSKARPRIPTITSSPAKNGIQNPISTTSKPGTSTSPRANS